MGSEFIERNKRKSMLSALLLLLGGKVKYVAVLLVAGAVSVPFLVPSETLSRITAFPAVAAVLHAVGLGGSDASSVSREQSQEMMKTELAKAAAESGRGTYWDKFLKAVNAAPPPAGSPSSMEMLRGGSDLIGPPVLKDTTPTKSDDVKGVASAEEQEKDPNANAVNLEKNKPGKEGADGGSMYGDLLGRGLAAASPFADRGMLGGPGGTSDRASGIYNRAVNQADDKVPTPGAPKRLSGKMGRVSSFAWKNMTRKTSHSSALNKLGNKKPMFQLSETFAMAHMAFESHSAEYESAYGGATYDGNEVDAQFLQTDAIAPEVPNVAFANSLLGGIDGLNKQAEACAAAGTKEGGQAGTDGTQMADIEQGNQASGGTEDGMDFANPPSCCDDDGINKWNVKVDRLVALCKDANANMKTVSDKCQTTFNPMGREDSSSPTDDTCPAYVKTHIHCIHVNIWPIGDVNWSCIKELLAWLVAFIFGGLVLTSLCMSGVFGGSAQSWLKGVVRNMSGYDTPELPTDDPNNYGNGNIKKEGT